MAIAHYKLNNIDDFINSLSLPRVARSILKTNKDCEIFAKSYWMNNQYVIDDLYDYREYKIESANVTYSEFLEKCIADGIRNTFQEVFIQDFTLEDIVLIQQSILDDKTSLESIYISFNKNININIMKYII